jgi:hypothetical protein
MKIKKFNENIEDDGTIDFEEYLSMLKQDINEALKLYTLTILAKLHKKSINIRDVEELINDFEIRDAVDDLSNLFLNNIDEKYNLDENRMTINMIKKR